MATSDLRVIVTEAQKQQVKQILASKNMNVSDYFRLMIDELIRKKDIPFETKIPNATTLAAIKRGKNKAKQLNKKYSEIHSHE
ncbi:type II toxin-antitoxin system RelB/DinJ family antitoxin [Orbaceae bacterium ac157xtp]